MSKLISCAAICVMLFVVAPAQARAEDSSTTPQAAGDAVGKAPDAKSDDTPPAPAEMTDFAVAAGVAMRDACKVRNPEKSKQYDDAFAQIVAEISEAKDIMAKPEFAGSVKKIADEIAARPADDKEITEQCASLIEVPQ